MDVSTCHATAFNIHSSTRPFITQTKLHCCTVFPSVLPSKSLRLKYKILSLVFSRTALGIITASLYVLCEDACMQIVSPYGKLVLLSGWKSITLFLICFAVFLTLTWSFPRDSLIIAHRSASDRLFGKLILNAGEVQDLCRCCSVRIDFDLHHIPPKTALQTFWNGPWRPLTSSSCQDHSTVFLITFSLLARLEKGIASVFAS
jgi:hypothetical protein